MESVVGILFVLLSLTILKNILIILNLNEIACLIKKRVLGPETEPSHIMIFVHIDYKTCKFSFQIKALSYKVEKRDTNILRVLKNIN